MGVGIRQSENSVEAAMSEARARLAEQLESFAQNTLDFIQRERDLLFGGSGLPALEHDLSHRPVLVVVRGYGYKRDLAALRSYIQEVRPVLIGVDGGADALREEGLIPDIIIGDRAWSGACRCLSGRSSGWWPWLTTRITSAISKPAPKCIHASMPPICR